MNEDATDAAMHITDELATGGNHDTNMAIATDIHDIREQQPITTPTAMDTLCDGIGEQQPIMPTTEDIHGVGEQQPIMLTTEDTHDIGEPRLQLSNDNLHPPRKPPHMPIPALTNMDPITRHSVCNCKSQDCLSLIVHNVMATAVIGTMLTIFPPSTHLIDSYTLVPIFGMELDGCTLDIPHYQACK